MTRKRHQMMRVGHQLQTVRCGQRGGSQSQAGDPVDSIGAEITASAHGYVNATRRRCSENTKMTKVSFSVRSSWLRVSSNEWEVS